MYTKITRVMGRVFALAFFGLAAAQSAAAGNASGINIKHWTSDNGVRVYYVHAPEIPMVQFELLFDAGAARDAENGGVALLTNALLAEGSGELDATAIATRFESVGAIFGSESQRDTASVSLRSLTEPDLLEQALDTFKMVVGKPSFPEDSFERERQRLLIGLRAEKESLESLSDKAFYKAVYGDHPYAQPERGTEETVKALKRDDVQAFYKKYYVARNAVLAIVGAVTEQEARSISKTIAASLIKGEAAAPLPPVNSLASAKQIAVDHPSQQAHILTGQPGVRRGDPDYYTLYVGNHILGGSGLVSRLAEEIREKRGLSYSQYSYFAPMRLEGPFVMGLQTKLDQAEQARELLHAELRRFIKDGPTEQELTAAKQNITGGFPLRIAGNSKIAGYLGMIGFYNLPLDYIDTFPVEVEKVTIGQIKDAFARRLDPDKFVTVTAGTPTNGAQ